MKLTLEEQLAGQGTLSIECNEELQKKNEFATFVQEDFPTFLRLLRGLSKEDQELMLSYYVLSKPQYTLAPLFHSTQTIMSFRLCMAEKKLSAVVLFGVNPTAEAMAPILEAIGTENLLNVPLSRLVADYATTRSFQRVANIHQIHRPDIRRSMSRSWKILIESKDHREMALGAYLHGLVDKAHSSGRGYSARKMAKMGYIYRKDPVILGQFVLKADDPDFDVVLTARANN